MKPARIRPTALLDLQIDLARWFRSQYAQQYARYWLKRVDEEAVPGQAEAFCDMMATTLIRSEPFYVVSPIVDFIWDATEDMPDQALEPTDLPVPEGFVWLESPLHMTDIHGATTVLKAFQWNAGIVSAPLGVFYPDTRENGVGLLMFTDRDDTSDDYWASMPDPDRVGRLPRLVVDHKDAWPYGEDIPESTRQVMQYLEEHPNVERVVVDTYSEGAETPLDADGVRRSLQTIVRTRRFISALWQFVQQNIVEVEEVYPDRKQRRRIQHSGLLDESAARVQLVTLRRRHRAHEPAHEGEGGDVNWSHQWWVRGHWRWQPYRSGYDSSHKCRHCGQVGVEHRRIYISPFIKGPEDKPLVHKKARVFHVSR